MRDHRRAQLQLVSDHRGVRDPDARTTRASRPGWRRHVGLPRRSDRARLPPPGDHRPVAGGDAAVRERDQRRAVDLQRRDLQPPRDSPRVGGDRRPRLAHRSLRHGDDRARLRAVGNRLHPPLPRHVRARDLGRPQRRPMARPRSHRNQALVLLEPPWPARVRERDQGLAAGSRAGARGRRGRLLPLPLVPDDAGAADTVQGDQEAARRHLAACPRRRDDRGTSLLGGLGRRAVA